MRYKNRNKGRQYLWSDSPLIMAHRGASGSFPENTLLSFEHAIEACADVLELDVRITRDNELVVFHDDTIDRVTDGHGYLNSLSFADIQRIDAGFHFTPDDGKAFPFRGRGLKVPRLAEVLQTFPDVRINIDLKDPSIRGAELLSDLIRLNKAEHRVLCASFYTKVLKHFREIEPEVVTSASKKEVTGFIVASFLGLYRSLRLDFEALQIPVSHKGIRLVTSRTIRRSHLLGLAVHVWTINNSDTMLQLLRIGSDGIITDFPHRLSQVRDHWIKNG